MILKAHSRCAIFQKWTTIRRCHNKGSLGARCKEGRGGKKIIGRPGRRNKRYNRASISLRFLSRYLLIFVHLWPISLFVLAVCLSFQFLPPLRAPLSALFRAFPSHFARSYLWTTFPSFFRAASIAPLSRTLARELVR